MKRTSRRDFLYRAGMWAITGVGMTTVFSSHVYCGWKDQMNKLKKSVDTIKDDIVSEKKYLKKNTGKTVEVGKEGVEYVKKTFEDITPEQEYYIGRAVGATILADYRPYKNKKSTQYVNTLGQTLAQASDVPETFGGYHFLILDSDAINGFAAPGGLIFVTRGMLRCCKNEDECAAVLAHEIAHVALKHGLQAIKKSRLTNVLTIAAVVGASMVAGEQVQSITSSFGGCISDITSTINKGYSRSFERSADTHAVTILKRVGYNPRGLVDMLHEMEKRLEPGGFDFVKTHPSPASRVADIGGIISGSSQIEIYKTRQARFTGALGAV